MKRAERVADPLEVIIRHVKGEIDAETARELLHKRVVRLREWYEGFFVPTFYLRKLDGDTLKELREKALRGDVRAAARLSVNAELERLTKMAEAGFPDIYRIFDRFLDAMSLMGGASASLCSSRRTPRCARLMESEYGWSRDRQESAGCFKGVGCS